jgi:hypothetical protein
VSSLIRAQRIIATIIYSKMISIIEHAKTREDSRSIRLYKYWQNKELPQLLRVVYRGIYRSEILPHPAERKATFTALLIEGTEEPSRILNMYKAVCVNGRPPLSPFFNTETWIHAFIEK